MILRAKMLNPSTSLSLSSFFMFEPPLNTIWLGQPAADLFPYILHEKVRPVLSEISKFNLSRVDVLEK